MHEDDDIENIEREANSNRRIEKREPFLRLLFDEMHNELTASNQYMIILEKLNNSTLPDDIKKKGIDILKEILIDELDHRKKLIAFANYMEENLEPNLLIKEQKKEIVREG